MARLPSLRLSRNLNIATVRNAGGLAVTTILGIAWVANWELVTSDSRSVLLGFAGAVIGAIVLLSLLHPVSIFRAIRLFAAVLVAGLLYFGFLSFGPYPDDFWQYNISLIIIGLIAGLIAGSWIFVLAVPFLVTLTSAVWSMLACDYCLSDGRSAGISFAGLVYGAFLSSPSPFGAAMGVLITEVLPRLAWWRRHLARMVPARSVGPAGPIFGSWKRHTGTLALNIGAIGILVISIIAVYELRRTLSTEAARFVLGPAWDGVGPRQAWMEGRVSQGEMEAYDEFPLYWLGESFGGYSPWQMTILSNGERIPLDHIGFAYGRCTALPCSYALGVGLQVICTNDPIERVVQRDGEGTVRGDAVVIRKTDTYAMIMAGAAIINIWVEIPADVEPPAQHVTIDDAIEQLQGIGKNASIGPGDPLPAPTRSACPW